MSPSQAAFLYAAVFAAIGGLWYLKFPQEAFYLRNWPFGTDSDGLTEAGERTYRRIGWFFLGVAGVLLLVIVFLL